jgi:hypothetical protein
MKLCYKNSKGEYDLNKEIYDVFSFFFFYIYFLIFLYNQYTLIL